MWNVDFCCCKMFVDQVKPGAFSSTAADKSSSDAGWFWKVQLKTLILIFLLHDVDSSLFFYTCLIGWVKIKLFHSHLLICYSWQLTNYIFSVIHPDRSVFLLQTQLTRIKSLDRVKWHHNIQKTLRFNIKSKDVL